MYTDVHVAFGGFFHNFPLFFMSPKGRVNKRAGGGGVDTARSTAKFVDLFGGSNFKG